MKGSCQTNHAAAQLRFQAERGSPDWQLNERRDARLMRYTTDLLPGHPASSGWPKYVQNVDQ